MSRIPRKIKKRRKYEEQKILVRKALWDVITKWPEEGFTDEEWDHAKKVSMESLRKKYGTDGLPHLNRLPPMTDDQKKAVMEERGGTFEVITIEEAIERYDLTEEETNAIKSHYLSDKGDEVNKQIQPFTDPPL